MHYYVITLICDIFDMQLNSQFSFNEENILCVLFKRAFFFNIHFFSDFFQNQVAFEILPTYYQHIYVICKATFYADLTLHRHFMQSCYRC